ncbi:endonuclease III domain-containing protein [Fundidesulfovibrio terrae]|uniref:endonuclease III domain-containing protein n=1 Tax=Fundidesulfovibrio terrae TaxID=2922866 RepID=UPI001FAF413A|nr:endonuclease III domain-containing protein [Fundidesulfovibrio terrae]
MSRRERLMEYYRSMLGSLGHRNWWPAKTPFEVCVGAILTQNTAWTGVEKAIANLEGAGALTPETLRGLPRPELEELIRPAGYFRLKAERLSGLLDYLERSCGFDLPELSRRDMGQVREELLGVRGVGPETADSILCYALGMPSFVVDAYTRRILSRHGLVPEDAHYDELRDYFMDVLDPDPALFNDFHAQLVRVGNRFCKTRKPLCEECPLGPFLS